MGKGKSWLPHLENSIPIEARGYSVSMYSIALEGWRRGLTLKFINKNRRKSEIYYSLAYNGREHLFTVSRGDKVSDEALEICRNKHLTKKYLKKAGIPTPEGEVFKKNIPDNEIINYANTLEYPLVIKPLEGTGGNGVITNIKNVQEFKDALNYVRYDLNQPDVIVEKHFDGRGYRVYVIGDKVIGAFDRIPANVIGDGKNTIKKLLKRKIEERDKNPALYKRPIKIDKEMHTILHSQGYTLDSVPPEGTRVMLKTKNNVSSGGDSIDVTDKVTMEVKDIAVRAVKAIPNMEQCGLDLIVDEENNTAVVLELNSMPSIRNHLFPNEGRARDIPKAIIDYYFPETSSDIYRDKPLFYFDIQCIFNTFQNGLAKEITVPNAPLGDISATRYVVSGEFKGKKYEYWLRRRAKSLKLHGYAKRLENNKVSVVVSGPTQSIRQFDEIIKNENPENVKITKVVEKSRKSPVKIGFEIISNVSEEEIKDGYFPVWLKDPRPKTKKRKSKRNKKLRQERDLYKKKYEKIVNSRSWRITKPIRMVSRVLKRILKLANKSK